ncbi:MAG: thiol:disulfide interchange protein DsbA/DsbL [Cellvibrionaceae bacterium]
MSKWLTFSIVALISAILFSQQNAVAQDQFVEGKDYVVINTPVRTADPSKIEITEVFWYGCPHCNQFRPVFEQWKNQQADDVKADHSPAMWSKNMVTHARIYYTAKVLGKQKEMHKDIFDAMHSQRKKLLNPKEIYPLFAKHGISQEKFDKTFKSFGVNSLVQQADARARSFGITGTPEVIINGKYRTSASLTGSQVKMLKVADYLIEKERAAIPAKSS